MQKKTIGCWALYDFANSAFTTLVITFIYATYFTKNIAPDVISGTVLWSRAISISMVFTALLAPIFGAIADVSKNRKFFLFLFTGICILFTGLLYFPVQGQVLESLILLVIANLSFELANVFYNSYLPDISPAHKIGRISGYGWALGYVGGLIAMIIAMIVFINPEQAWFGLSRESGEHIRACNLFVALWYAIFSLPMFFYVRDPKPQTDLPKQNILRSSFGQLKQTFQKLKKYKQITIFLLARLFYNDGLVTLFAFGAIYATGTLDFSMEEVMIFGIILNITAGIGAFVMGYFDDWLGGKKIIQLSLVLLIVATILAIMSTSKTAFWIAGILVGLCSGPTQSASRSFMGRLVPRGKVNEFFGFFALSGKLTSFLGPLFFGLMTKFFHSQRAGISIILFFFILGLFFLHYVDEEQAKKDKKRLSHES